ncbi:MULTISPECIES: entry exclusion protein TrbK [unclassified Rhizobium]|uniref:entry exclusion protein TrbK n=1 Tax=unclassified Rhizobium TaxID=2613769 RepID=UPI001C83B664|nr:MULTISPECIES: entry exclusion protein TrbK [unclassified Rhizobium]MBX5166871.1 entry exclusion protein TrbK [Rhizobium sp. NZLR4b]MBX5186409.1 entry exclusion protein TrbK [Rhizobium sp. NZLR5]
MSRRLIVIIALVAIGSAAGASVITWIVVQPQATPISGSGTAAMNSSSNEEQRRHRGEFFGGNPEPDIRGDQEMKPRW